MLDRRSQDYWFEMTERKKVQDDNFRSGRIGEATYLVSLRILGFTDREASEELNMLKAVK